VDSMGTFRRFSRRTEIHEMHENLGDANSS
jgi:hypothetical protein